MTDNPKITLVSNKNDLDAKAAMFRDVAADIVSAQNKLLKIALESNDTDLRRRCLNYAQSLIDELMNLQGANARPEHRDECPF